MRITNRHLGERLDGTVCIRSCTVLTTVVPVPMYLYCNDHISSGSNSTLIHDQSVIKYMMMMDKSRIYDSLWRKLNKSCVIMATENF